MINFFGMGFVKLQLGDTIIAFNPISKDYDPKAPKFGADLALISFNDAAFNGIDQVTFGPKQPFVIAGPGEYEMGGIMVRGLPSQGPGETINTIFTTIFDGLRICHLGALANANLNSEVIEEIGVVDILFVPVGGGHVLDAKAAAKICTTIEPALIVPICYNSAAELKKFLQEWGEDEEQVVDKLTIKRKDLEGKEGEVVVIKS